MFSDDEDELELLRQYGERDLNADESDAHSRYLFLIIFNFVY